jgi:DNA-binding response OmpR family regulator
VALIALTGWGQEDDRRRSHEAGFDYHLVKPVDVEELQALLASLPGRHPPLPDGPGNPGTKE